MSIKLNAAKLRIILKNRLKPFDSSPYAGKYNEGIGTALEIIDNMNREAINKKIKKELNHLNKPHKVTEVCSYCKNEVNLKWDTKHDGYNIYCPCCGKEMKLSNAYHNEVTVKKQTDDKES